MMNDNHTEADDREAADLGTRLAWLNWYATKAVLGALMRSMQSAKSSAIAAPGETDATRKPQRAVVTDGTR
jgi:hypothetical protein